jgi:hypothetical protein
MKTDCIYQRTSAPQDERPRRVTGQYLAKNRLSARDRARLAAGMVDGRVKVKDWTVRQTARLCRVSEPYVVAARKLPPAPESLAEHLARATSAEWLEAARTVGVAAVWDRMVLPLL